jgi:glycine betaine catabolism B
MFDAIPASSSVLAFVTTVHAVLFVLRLQSGRRWAWWLALPSALFAAGTWVMALPAWLALAVSGDIAWFGACHLLAPVRRGPLEEAEAAHRFVPLRIVETRDESASIRTFRLSRPTGFDFVPGQFLTVQVTVGERRHVRCYSISSAPENEEYLEISVRRQGLVSGLLHAAVKTGDTVHARRPAGHFVYPFGDDRPLVLLAGGIGVTPLMAMVRHAVAADRHRSIALLYSVRHAGDVAFRADLEQLERRHPRLRVVITVTGQRAASGLRHGRIDAAVIRDAVANPLESIYMICGPLPMIDATRSMLGALGIPSEQVRFEAFEAAAASGAKLPGGDASDTPKKLTLAHSRREADIEPGESLLDAAERAGCEIPSICRSGVCGTCRTRLVRGRARCTSETLAPVERENGFVLPCVTWADDDCELEA